MDKRLVASLLMTAVLTACGGGSSTATTAAAVVPAPDVYIGVYRGTTGDGRTLTSMILNDGTYYYFYSGVPVTTTVAASGSTAASTTTVTNEVGGVVIGTGTGKSGSFSSTTAYDYQMASTGLSTGVSASTLSASYVSTSSMMGTITHNATGVASTFTSSYNTTLSSAVPSLASIASIYTGTVGTAGGGTESLQLIVLPGGTVTGQSASGCFFSGTIAAHATNNAYDLNITFAAATCTYNGVNMLGMGLYDAAASTLYGAAVKTDKTGGIMFSVKKLASS